MARPQSKKLPYFSRLLQLILKEFKHKTNFNNNWNSKQAIVNSILNIIIHDEVGDELREWWNARIESERQKNPINKQMGYSSDVVSKLCSGKVFLDYRIWKYYEAELVEGNSRFHKYKFMEMIRETPLAEYDRLERICHQFHRYISHMKRNEVESIDCLNMGQLYSLYQNNNFLEYFAICLLVLSSDMCKLSVEEEYKLYYTEEDNLFLDDFIEDVKVDLAKGKFFDKVDIHITIHPLDRSEMYQMVTRFKYEAPTIKKSGKSYFVAFKFLFESEELARRHELNSLIINDIQYADKIRMSSSFHDGMNRGMWSKVYEADGIVPASYYKVERICTSCLRFPIGDIIYRLPRFSKYFKVTIELIEDKVSSYKLDGSLFAPLEKDELRNFKKNRMLLEFEGEGFFPKGTGYKVLVRPLLYLLKQDEAKLGSWSEEEVEEDKKWY